MGLSGWFTERKSKNMNNTMSKEKIGEFVELIKLDNNAQYNRLRQFVNDVNKAGGTYHKLHLGNGLVIHGDYDMTKYVNYYNLPVSLKGKTVLDIGTSSGYFALECARRGGQVTAINIWEGPLLSRLVKFMNTDVRYVKKSIYELDTNFGQFDLVVCGSLLLHLPDPFGAIQKIRSVCRGQAIVSTSCTPDSMTNPRPVCEFVGLKALGGDYCTYWSVGAVALRNMFLLSGFSRVENELHFTLISETGQTEFATPHVVMTGII